MPHPTDVHTGTRIADYRKLRHLTQTGLSERAFVSRSLIAKVERGERPASPALIGVVARALQVPVAVLTGQPYVSELRQDKIDHLIAPLSEAMLLWNVGPDPDITPRPVEQLSADTDDMCRLACAADFGGMGPRLPGLIGELTTALHLSAEGQERRRAAGVLGRLYWASAEFALRLGHHELAARALDRMAWAADAAQDPLLLAVQLYRQCQYEDDRARPEIGMRLVERAQDFVEQADDPRSTAARAVSGTLYLRSAYITARTRDGAATDEHLNLAKEYAGRIGREVPDLYWLTFGPTNVAQNAVSTRLVMERPSEMLKAAKELHFPAAHNRGRVGWHWVDMAHAYTQLGKADGALAALQRGRTAAPQLLRYHPVVRDVVGTLVRRQRRASEGLASLAAWVGM
jgi:transcriptional regulator with XRE-family HTH domain